MLWIIDFSAVTLLDGDWKGIWLVKNWVFACWWWRFGWNFAHLAAPVVTTTSIILSCSKIQNGDILVPAYLGCPRRWPLNKFNVVLWCYGS